MKMMCNVTMYLYKKVLGLTNLKLGQYDMFPNLLAWLPLPF